ncbi:MAG: DUF1631 family protein [Pseudomonadales bacterium]|nr:DUF1631 family protein [Pseudomonadales bacterium]
METNTQRYGPNVIELPSVNRRVTAELVKRVKASVDNKMFYLLSGLTIDVADALFEEMREMEEQQALASHFNIMRALKTEAGTYRQEFGSMLNLSWMNLLKGKDEPAVADTVGAVAKDLQLYCRKHQNHYKILLEEVRQRFCGMTNMDLSFHPMLPANFYLCFWYSTEHLSLSYEERRLVVSLFHRFVMDRFGQILAAVNDRMKGLEIEPVKF